MHQIWKQNVQFNVQFCFFDKTVTIDNRCLYQLSSDNLLCSFFIWSLFKWRKIGCTNDIVWKKTSHIVILLSFYNLCFILIEQSLYFINSTFTLTCDGNQLFCSKHDIKQTISTHIVQFIRLMKKTDISLFFNHLEIVTTLFRKILLGFLILGICLTVHDIIILSGAQISSTWITRDSFLTNMWNITKILWPLFHMSRA